MRHNLKFLNTLGGATVYWIGSRSFCRVAPAGGKRTSNFWTSESSAKLLTLCVACVLQ